MRSPLRHRIHGALLGNIEPDPVVVLLPRLRREVRVDLLRDRHVRMAEDLRQPEDVAAVENPVGRERVAQVVEPQRPR